MEEHKGLRSRWLARHQTDGSVLKPYGVWQSSRRSTSRWRSDRHGDRRARRGAIVLPASDTPYTGGTQVFRDAGLPDGVFNFITDREASRRGTDRKPGGGRLLFTSSLDVGMNILRRFSTNAKPCIAEMGGKNPAIVMPSASLDDATEGVLRSAFGMGGQKCSACSRLYVHRDIRKDFMDLLIAKTETRTIGDPLKRETFLGPLINESAVKTYEKAIRLAKKAGRIADGGKTLKAGDFHYGYSSSRRSGSPAEIVQHVP
jgi:1-pyrroline-5-carboxylate dehydrogenase